MPVSMLSTSLFSDRKSYSRFNALDTIYTPPRIGGPGMVLIKPASITHSGTSATLGTNGQITFSAVSSVSINNCFNANFENYRIVIRYTSTNDLSVRMRYRVSGADASGSDYTNQVFSSTGSTEGAAQSTTTSAAVAVGFSSPQGAVTDLFGPYLASATAGITKTISSSSTVRIDDQIHNHVLSTSYDGCTVFVAAGTMTGALQIYGIRS